MPAVTSEDLFAKLSTLTGMTAREWQDFLSLTPEQQMVVAQGYADQDWTRPGDTFAEVLSVLITIGTVAGVVSGVSGAVLALKAL